LTRGNPGTVTIPQYLFNKNKATHAKVLLKEDPPCVYREFSVKVLTKLIFSEESNNERETSIDSVTVNGVLSWLHLIVFRVLNPLTGR